MFYPKLEESLEYRDNPELVERFDAFLRERWASQSRLFGPAIVAGLLGLPLERAIRLLSAAASLGVLRPQYSLHCPDCGHIYTCVVDVSMLPQGEVRCLHCGVVFSSRDELVWVNFLIVEGPEEAEVAVKKALR